MTWLTLLRRYWPALVALAAGVLVFGFGYRAADARWRARYAADSVAAAAHRASLDSSLVMIAVEIDSLRHAYRQDTLTLTVWRDRWRTVVESLPPDSIPVPGPVVREIVRVGDSTITACTNAILTCEQRVSVATALGDSLARQRDLVIGQLARERKRKDRWGCVVGVGYSVGDIRRGGQLLSPDRTGFTCGWRPF